MVKDSEIKYNLKRSKRARSIRLAVYYNGDFVVTAPYAAPLSMIENFINKKTDWVKKKIEYFKQFEGRIGYKNSKTDYLKFKNPALELAKSRIKHFNSHYNFKVGKVSVRNQKSRWGSCSKSGNLSFNYKIALLSPEHADYIIVHELCHIKEFNHSKNFWALVAETIPEWRTIRRLLKTA